MTKGPTLIEKISKREGIGDLLGGSYRAAKRLGQGRLTRLDVA